MFGFMTITALLSMFISNTGATAMIIPIAVAVLDEMQSCQRKQSVAVVQTDDTTSPRRLYSYAFTEILFTRLPFGVILQIWPGCRENLCNDAPFWSHKTQI